MFCVSFGVGWWLGENLPGAHLSLEKCQIALDSFIYTVYIIRTSFTKPKEASNVGAIFK